ncbi:unnamed protein product [Rotaria socialis]|uniref:Uncharacterized protein n=3 Tax=Rotaria socialis TaxID=392032 RepID=A0A818EK99_9BILA|nr:unnamed protein product [Rotaria socialis]CAF3463595.1 unnamed protein product [Rotaria socialis]CAF4129230.1 unnamed protein product [Rotaria socialis]CAF4166408.1 unnamed protein product [Rotaria socialis]CAF4839636.1 unnamed protein product [Rotaria socialis]
MHMDDANNNQLCRALTKIFLMLLLLILFITMSNAGKQMNDCQPMFISEVNSPSRRRQGPPYLTYIISSIPQRFNSTLKELNTVLPGFFNVKHKEPVPHSDSRILRHGDMNASSLLLTNIDLWSAFGWSSSANYSDNDWILIFEDDVRIVSPEIMKTFYEETNITRNHINSSHIIAKTIEESFELAKNDGILYLGTCEPLFNDSKIHHSFDGLMQIRRGMHFCTHAIAYTKWRARKYWNDISISRLLHYEFTLPKIVREWQRLTKTYPFCTAPNVNWPLDSTYFGFFYPDNGTYASIT